MDWPDPSPMIGVDRNPFKLNIVGSIWQSKNQNFDQKFKTNFIHWKYQYTTWFVQENPLFFRAFSPPWLASNIDLSVLYLEDMWDEVGNLSHKRGPTSIGKNLCYGTVWLAPPPPLRCYFTLNGQAWNMFVLFLKELVRISMIFELIFLRKNSHIGICILFIPKNITYRLFTLREKEIFNWKKNGIMVEKWLKRFYWDIPLNCSMWCSAKYKHPHWIRHTFQLFGLPNRWCYKCYGLI